MNWDDRISLWLLSAFGILGLLLALVRGFICALRPVLAAISDLREQWRSGRPSRNG
ncbi:hypothetical protein ACFC18_48350 [Streptomyces sp. NPDC056121]|uniref:hypothetical protein n=1 Tax=Streptomyces sp. NPDC056121 TaxID=3345718 RepID=UPI0035E10557